MVRFLWFTPHLSSSIASSTISPEQGLAYVVAIQDHEGWFYALPTDTNKEPQASSLALFEDGRALSPAHSVHSQIRESGAGRYSHWHDLIIFSSSDGSDPRINGRIYSIQSPTIVKLPSRIFLLAMLAVGGTGLSNISRTKYPGLFRIPSFDAASDLCILDGVCCRSICIWRAGNVGHCQEWGAERRGTSYPSPAACLHGLHRLTLHLGSRSRSNPLDTS